MKYWREYRRRKTKAAATLAHIAVKITLGFIVHALYINIGIFGYKKKLEKPELLRSDTTHLVLFCLFILFSFVSTITLFSIRVIHVGSGFVIN